MRTGEWCQPEAEAAMNDEDDDSALARRHSAEALRVLAEIADDPNADAAVREEARQGLEKWLVRLMELGHCPPMKSQRQKSQR
jgi:hypothetical protein